MATLDTYHLILDYNAPMLYTCRINYKLENKDRYRMYIRRLILKNF